MVTLTSFEKLVADNVGCKVNCLSGKSGINLGLNWITEKNKYGENIKLTTPEVKGILVYFPEIGKSYYQEFDSVKLEVDSVKVITTKEALNLFLIYFLALDSSGKEFGLNLSRIDEIINRYFKYKFAKTNELHIESESAEAFV